MLKLEVAAESFELLKPFTISRSSITAVDVVTVTIIDGANRGRGECRPYARYDETVESVINQVNSCREAIEAGAGSSDLPALLPSGAARNAIDCAFWDLQAKRTRTPVWSLAGLREPSPCEVTYTISLDEPEVMARASVECGRSLLKLKLGGIGDMERVRTVRKSVPKARLIVDANEGWDMAFLEAHTSELRELAVELIEQPLKSGQDHALQGFVSPVALCADESCHTVESLKGLPDAYSFVNVKLDKTGGLTGAIQLVEAARQSNLKLMLGCMMASSLAMAPASLLAGQAEYVDLDAPLLLARDRDAAIEFKGETMMPPRPELWG